MNRCLVIGCATAFLVVLAGAPASAKDGLYHIQIGVAEIDGKPVLVEGKKEGALDLYKPDGVDKSDNFFTIQDFRSGNALTYELEGESTMISFGKADAAGTLWEVKGPRRNTTIQAAKGKYKGWYLDAAEEVEKVEEGGKTLRVQRLVLSKEPKQITQITRFAVSK